MSWTMNSEKVHDINNHSLYKKMYCFFKKRSDLLLIHFQSLK